MTLAVPPRFVPTLTEIVAPPQSFDCLAPPEAESEAPVETLPETLPQRISDSVNLALETNLKEAISNLVVQQMEVLRPLLVEEVERLVRESVRKALAQEHAVSQTIPDTPPPG